VSNIIKLKKFIIDNKFYLIVFSFSLIINILAPISGDDWGNYFPKITFGSSISIAYKAYFSFESRVASRFLINFLCYYKWVWNILCALAITTIYYSIIKFFKINNNNGYMLSAIAIFAIPCAMFGQVYVWITGSITYLFPTAIIMGYFAYIYTHKELNVKQIILFAFLNIITPFFVDNCGVPLVVGNILYVVYNYFITHKISKTICFYTFLSIFSLVIVYISPGSASRLSTTEVFASYSIFKKCFSNIYNFIDYLFYANPLLIILTYIPVFYYIYNKLKKFPFSRIMVLILFSIIPIYSIIFNLYEYNPYIDSIYSLDFYWPNDSSILKSNIIYIFWYFYLLIYVISISKICKKNKWYYYVLLIIALSSNGATLLSPTWGYRTTFFTSIMLSGITIGLINNIIIKLKYKKIDLNIFIKILYYGLLLYLLSVFILVCHFNNVRLNNISKQYSDNKKNIVIKICPIRYMWNYNPFMEFHYNAYRSYLKENNIIYKEKGIEFTFEPLKRKMNVIKGW
jgi:hypothetical protein